MFLRLWLTEGCRDALLAQLDRESLRELRLSCHDFAAKAAPFLFDEVSVNFKSSSFSRPARVAALERIGQYATTFSFSLPHTEETSLPPLVDPLTGEQREFIYTPQVHKPATLVGKVKEPKYGSWEMTELLLKQYPPLFHAATNVPSFMRVFELMPNLERLKVHCPDADLSRRYKRSVVDYALISIRVAVERASLPRLNAMTLANIHPSGLLYLQPLLGFGSTPSSMRRWKQIEKLEVRMDSFPTNDPKTSSEHLKLLYTYLRAFSRNLTSLSFQWNRAKGPCPLVLDSEPCLAQHPALSPRPSQGEWTMPPRKAQKVFANSSPQMFERLPPPPPPPPRKPVAIRLNNISTLQPLTFPLLTHLSLNNASMSASQLATFLERHKRTINELSLDEIYLSSGTWDDALRPLTDMAEDSRRHFLGRDSCLFSDATLSSIGSPDLDIGRRPVPASHTFWEGSGPSLPSMPSLTSMPELRESMDVPLMMSGSSLSPSAPRILHAPPPLALRGPFISGPLMAPLPQMAAQPSSGNGLPLRRWFSKGHGSKLRKEKPLPTAPGESKLSGLINDALMHWF